MHVNGSRTNADGGVLRREGKHAEHHFPGSSSVGGEATALLHSEQGTARYAAGIVIG